jgi:hypothetical protein
LQPRKVWSLREILFLRLLTFHSVCEARFFCFVLWISQHIMCNFKIQSEVTDWTVSWSAQINVILVHLPQNNWYKNAILCLTSSKEPTQSLQFMPTHFLKHNLYSGNPTIKIINGTRWIDLFVLILKQVVSKSHIFRRMFLEVWFYSYLQHFIINTNSIRITPVLNFLVLS